MGFTGLMKLLRRGDGICRTADKMVARRWDSPTAERGDEGEFDQLGQ